jgi:hypothetical protein
MWLTCTPSSKNEGGSLLFPRPPAARERERIVYQQIYPDHIALSAATGHQPSEELVSRNRHVISCRCSWVWTSGWFESLWGVIMDSSFSFHNLQRVNKVDGVESALDRVKDKTRYPCYKPTIQYAWLWGCRSSGAFWRKGGREGSSHESSRCFVVEMELPWRVGTLLFNYVSHGFLVSDSAINDAAGPPLLSFVDKMQRSAFLF